jgi:hypothetical protein
VFEVLLLQEPGDQPLGRPRGVRFGHLARLSGACRVPARGLVLDLPSHSGDRSRP